MTEDEKRAFDDAGFFVRRGMVVDHEVHATREALERLYAKAQMLRATGEHDGAFFVVNASGDGPAVVQRVVWAGGAEPGLLTLSADARFVDSALALLGTSSCEQLLCQAHYKMPNDGVAFAWHRDIQHRDKGNDTWRDVNGRGSFVQTILLVDDMTESNGPLKFRSRMGEVTTVTGRAGDVLFFGPYAEHGSLPNESASPRRVLINGYAAPGANRRVYPGRGSGRGLRRPTTS
jgi:hypothetical protein